MQRIRWLGHVARMEETVPPRKALDDEFHGKRGRGGRGFGGDQVIADIESLGVRNWTLKHPRSRGVIEPTNVK